MVSQKVSEKIISFEEAKAIVNEETDLHALLLEIKKRKEGKEVPYGNLHFFEMEKVFGKKRTDRKGNEKIPSVCPFHETKNTDSTNILKGDVDVIYCFTGGCVANKAVTPVNAFMILELGVNPKVIGTPASGSMYRKAVYRLASRLGYNIREKKRKWTLEEKKQMKKEKMLLEAAEMYHDQFLKSEVAQDYFLKTRGFQYGTVDAWELIKKYKIGFAPNPYPSKFLYQKLAPNYTTQEMLDTSLVKWIEYKDDNGNALRAEPIDFHSDAITIPYWKRNFKTVTNIYSRGINAPKEWRHLRLAGGVDEPVNFEIASKYEEIFLVEGELSWLSFIALEYENAMGNRGTNGLSDEHVELLVEAREKSNGEYCKRVYIVFDGDKAGRKATIKTGQKLMEKDFEVYIIMLADGEDPNDILQNKKENAKAYLDKKIAEAVSYYTFLALSQISKERQNTTKTLKELGKAKQILIENGIKNELELRIIAQEFADRKKLPLDLVWSVWEKKNKETDVLYKEKFAFMTSNYDAFVLTRYKFPGRTMYVEDVEFTFLTDKPVVKTLVIDKESYTEEERTQIQVFGKDNQITVLLLSGFENIIDMSEKELMEKINQENKK